MGQVWHEAMGHRTQLVHGSCRGDVEGAVVRVTPGEIGRLFGKNDGAEVVAFGVPHPNALRSGDVHVASAIDLHAVGNTVVFGAWFFSEDATVRNRAVGIEVEDVDVAVVAIVDIEVPAVGRES